MATATTAIRRALNALKAERFNWAKANPTPERCGRQMGRGRTCKSKTCAYPSHWSGLMPGDRLYDAGMALVPKVMEELRFDEEADKHEVAKQPQASPKPKRKPKPPTPTPVGDDPAMAVATALDVLLKQGADKTALNALEERVASIEAAKGIRREVVVQKDNGHEIGKVEGVLHYAFDRVLSRFSVGEPARPINVLVCGPTGSGKTHLMEQVAEALGLPFHTNSLSGGVSEGVLLGRLLPVPESADSLVESWVELKARLIDEGLSEADAEEHAAKRLSTSNFTYVKSPFVEAYEEGGLYLADECDAADPNVLLILNQGLANGTLPIPHRPGKPYAKRHPKFRCGAATNTWGHGSDRQYVGRTQLDAAFLNRFTMGQLSIDYDPAVEEALSDRAVLAWGRRVREEIRKKSLRRVLSTRNLIDATALKRAGLKDWDWRESYFADWSADDIDQMPNEVKANK